MRDDDNTTTVKEKRIERNYSTLIMKMITSKGSI